MPIPARRGSTRQRLRSGAGRDRSTRGPRGSGANGLDDLREMHVTRCDAPVCLATARRARHAGRAFLERSVMHWNSNQPLAAEHVAFALREGLMISSAAGGLASRALRKYARLPRSSRSESAARPLSAADQGVCRICMPVCGRSGSAWRRHLSRACGGLRGVDVEVREVARAQGDEVAACAEVRLELDRSTARPSRVTSNARSLSGHVRPRPAAPEPVASAARHGRAAAPARRDRARGVQAGRHHPLRAAPHAAQSGRSTNNPCSIPLTMTIPDSKYGYTLQAPLNSASSSSG